MASSALQSQVPYEVSWTLVGLRVMTGAVPPSQILHAFNGAVVGLAVDSGRYSPLSGQHHQHQQQQQQQQQQQLRHSQQFAAKGRSLPWIPLVTPLCPCIGLGGLDLAAVYTQLVIHCGGIRLLACRDCPRNRSLHLHILCADACHRRGPCAGEPAAQRWN